MGTTAVEFIDELGNDRKLYINAEDILKATEDNIELNLTRMVDAI